MSVPSAYARFKNNPAPLGSLALGIFAVVLLALDHTSTGRSNGAFEGALIAAIVAMIAGAAGLLMAIRYGVASALMSATGFVLGLVVLIVGLSSSPY
jgi:methylaspartate ammonia-lyase